MDEWIFEVWKKNDTPTTKKTTKREETDDPNSDLAGYAPKLRY